MSALSITSFWGKAKKYTLMCALFVAAFLAVFTTNVKEVHAVYTAGEYTSEYTGSDGKGGISGNWDGAAQLREHMIDELDYTEAKALGLVGPIHDSMWPLVDRTINAYNKATQNVDIVTRSMLPAAFSSAPWDSSLYSYEIKNEQGVQDLKEFLDAKAALAAFKLKILDDYGYDGPGAKAKDRQELLDEKIIAEQLSKKIQNGEIKAGHTGTNGVTFGTDASIDTEDETGADTGTVGRIDCGVTGAHQVMSCIAVASYTVVLKGSSLLLALVGMVFNLTLNFTLNIGQLFADSNFGIGGTSGAIYLGWSTIRDFINVAFIFVLLYVAISTILQNDKYGAKKMVVKIVIAALLINFSLFFTKAIIDLSNVIAMQFYAQILDSSVKAGGNPNNIDGGLSAAMLNSMGLKTLWSQPNPDNDPIDVSAQQYADSFGLTPYQLITISLLGGLFILIFTLVFFMAIVQFLIRTIILLFLMVTSPIGFIGEAIPALGNSASEWRKRLSSNAVFAPAYMAILYVICQIMFGSSRDDIVGTGGGFVTLLTGNGGNRTNEIGILFWFVLICGLLITGQGAARAFADSFGKGLTGKIEGMLKKGFKSVPKLGWKGTKMAGAAAGAGAAFGGRKLFTGTKAGNLLLSKGGKMLGGQRLYNRMAQKEVDRMKDKAKNARQGRTETSDAFKQRKARMVADAQLNQARGFGFDRSDFKFDKDGKIAGMEENDVTKAKVAAMEDENSRKWIGRKAAQERADAFKKSIGKSALKDKEDAADALKAKIDDVSSAPSPSTFDDTAHQAEIAKRKEAHRKFTTDPVMAAKIAANDIETLNYARTLEKDLEDAEKELKKAESAFGEKQDRLQSEYENKKDKMDADLKKLKQSIKEQKERDEKAEKEKDKKDTKKK